MNYRREKTEDSPLIELVDNKLTIIGRSLPENVHDVYDEVIGMIKNIKINSLFTFYVDLEYFNTASSKIILDLLLILEENENRKLVVVEWHHQGDEDMEEAAKEFAEIVEGLNFRILH